MVHDTAASVINLRANLWPRAPRLTPEQADLWRRVCRNIPEAAGLEAVKLHAAECPFPITPPEFSAKVRSLMPRPTTASGPRHQRDEAEIRRAELSRAFPARAAEISMMSAPDLLREVARLMLDRAVQCYGLRSRATVARWAAWRASLDHQQGLAVGAWSAEAEVDFLAAIERGEVHGREHVNARPKPAGVT